MDTTTDRIALHELAARYGDLIDARDWEALATVFADRATFDLTDIGAGVLDGLAAIQAHMDQEPHHPLSHHITNIYVEELDGDRGVLRSRVLGMLGDGRVGSGAYRDEVVRTPAGWRVAHRHFALRRKSPHGREPDAAPGGVSA